MKARNSRWKRRISAALAAVILLAVPTNAKADAYWPEGPTIASPSAIVIEINSGAILYEKNSHQVNYPASITKVLTTLVALENSELDEIVTFSDDAINLNQGDTSHIARDYGEKMTMKECLYAVMLESANECAYAVAEHVGKKLGGDYQTFIELMNQRAKELGCLNTQFTNANGLPDNNHWTSAYDMALISAEAYKNEDYRIMVGTRSYRIPPTNKHSVVTPLNNHHAMISNHKTNIHLYQYCTGGKTGYTTVANGTLVSYAEKDGLTLVCVVMNTDPATHYTQTRALFDHCFQNFQTVAIGENGTVGNEEKENTGMMNHHDSYVKLDENAQIVLPITADPSEVEMSVVEEDLPEGAIAQLSYTYGGRVVGRANVILSGVEVEENYFEDQAPSDKNIVIVKPIHIIGIIAGIIVVIALILVGKRLYDNYYVIRHDFAVKRQRKERFRPISDKKRKWRKRDRMFK